MSSNFYFYLRGYVVFVDFFLSIAFFTIGIMIGANFIADLTKLPSFIYIAPITTV